MLEAPGYRDAGSTAPITVADITETDTIIATGTMAATRTTTTMIMTMITVGAMTMMDGAANQQ
jgi:hypothetical protein